LLCNGERVAVHMLGARRGRRRIIAAASGAPAFEVEYFAANSSHPEDVGGRLPTM
jgi:hypothetical protein